MQGSQRLVWHWYVYGDRSLTSGFAIKALEATSWLTRDANLELIVTLATAYDDTAHDRLQSFLDCPFALHHVRLRRRGLRRMIAPPLVVHVIHRLDFGGLENGLVNLVNCMPADRFRHAIVCLAGFEPDFRDRIQRSDVEVISLGKRPGKDLAPYARMWRVLRRLAPSVVHTRNLGTVDMQWIAAAAGVPHRVHGEHGWEASDPCGRNPKALRIRRACRPVIHLYVPMSQGHRTLAGEGGARGAVAHPPAVQRS